MASLNEARDQATQLAGDLEQLDAAGDGLEQVQRLVGRLRDVAVVALDGTLQPAQRAVLQRQVDLMLGEIDTVANETQVDDGLVRGGASSASPAGAGDGQLSPFRAIGTSMLGLTELAVRSADQALAATGALDVATSRLQRNGKLLNGTVAQLEGALRNLTSPPTTAAGEPALDGETTALGSAMLLHGSLLANPDRAVQAQAELDVSRVRWLLDSPGR